MRDDEAILQDRPDIEQITRTYQSMHAQIRDRLSAEVGPLEWVDEDDASTGGCGFDYQDAEGATSRTLDRWFAPGNLPDAQWDRAVAIVAEISARYSYEAPRTIVNRPSDHQVRISDPYGGELIFGTAVNTLLGVNTGCHLSPEAHSGPSSGG